MDALKQALSEAREVPASYRRRFVYFPCGENQSSELESLVRKEALAQHLDILSMVWCHDQHIVGNATWTLQVCVRDKFAREEFLR